jgi:ubiquilin
MSPGTGSARSDEANNNERLARQLNVESVPENSLNTQALPNPWAPTSNTNTNNTTTTTDNNNQRQQSSNSTTNNPAAASFPSFGGGNLSCKSFYSQFIVFFY